MAMRRSRRNGRSQALLPLRTLDVSNSLSCWYCDWKFYVLNEPLFAIGQRYARYLRVWFTVGVVFSFIALVGVSLLLIWGLLGSFYLHKGTYLNSLSILWLFSTTTLMNAGIMFFSTLFSVTIHEFGHAIAAASEGIQVDYIAIFLAIIFPGALVALNYDVLQNLQRFAALRIYCAGIWHNLVFSSNQEGSVTAGNRGPLRLGDIVAENNIGTGSPTEPCFERLRLQNSILWENTPDNYFFCFQFSAVCGLTIVLLPLVLYPLYIHGEMPMVLGMPQTSPLSGYLSPGDAIMSVDGSKIRYPSEWSEKMIEINSQILHKDVSGRKGYCVPNSWLDMTKIKYVVGDNFTCPDEHAIFMKMPCLNSSLLTGIRIEDKNENKGEKFCLIARDIVKLKRCVDGWKMNEADRRNSCACLEEESCMEPVQIPGASWVEISYSTPYLAECLQLKRNISENTEISDPTSACGGTFVFVGDALSLAYSIHLTSYQPRWSYLSANVPNLLEKILSCTLHVSATLGVLNSLPVFFLDGESILEMVLYYITWLNPRRRHRVLRLCLISGSTLCITLVARILYSTFSLSY